MARKCPQVSVNCVVATSCPMTPYYSLSLSKYKLYESWDKKPIASSPCQRVLVTAVMPAPQPRVTGIPPAFGFAAVPTCIDQNPDISARAGTNNLFYKL